MGRCKQHFVHKYIVFIFLIDPDVVGTVSVEALRESKQFQKVTQKMEKELDMLKKRHEKVSQGLAVFLISDGTYDILQSVQAHFFLHKFTGLNTGQFLERFL